MNVKPQLTYTLSLSTSIEIKPQQRYESQAPAKVWTSSLSECMNIRHQQKYTYQASANVWISSLSKSMNIGLSESMKITCQQKHEYHFIFSHSGKSRLISQNIVLARIQGNFLHLMSRCKLENGPPKIWKNDAETVTFFWSIFGNQKNEKSEHVETPILRLKRL